MSERGERDSYGRTLCWGTTTSCQDRENKVLEKLDRKKQSILGRQRVYSEGTVVLKSL